MTLSKKQENGLKLSAYVVESGPIKNRGSASAVRLLFSTLSGACIVVPEQVWQVISSGGDVSAVPSALKPQLRSGKFLVDSEDNELESVIQENTKAIATNSTLYQVVQPSAWCQLGCPYCGQEHAQKHLSPAAQEGFIERVALRLRRGDYNHLEICWFGGEPTCGMNVIRGLTRRLRKIASEGGCTYSARIVTNGVTLTPSLADELLYEHSVREAEITLDGTAEFHDRRRVTKRGGPSFDRIFRNLTEVAEKSELGLLVRCNVDASNKSGVAPLITALADHNLQERIRFYTAPIHSWGNDAHKGSLSKEDYARLEMEWIAMQLRLGFTVGLLPPRKKIVCLAVRRDAELIDAYDNSFNCTEVSQVPTYGRPNKYATRLAGESHIQPSRKAAELAVFNDDVWTGRREQCRACRMLPVCGGACPKAWDEGQVPCPSVKFNIQDRLNVLYALSKLDEIGQQKGDGIRASQ